eukprot:COSAG03_NODE_26076_length_261_cov_1.265432_1_plen_87_part_11
MGTWAFVRSDPNGTDGSTEGWLRHEYLHEISSAEEGAEAKTERGNTPEPAAAETTKRAASPVAASGGDEAEDINTPTKGQGTEAPAD